MRSSQNKRHCEEQPRSAANQRVCLSSSSLCFLATLVLSTLSLASLRRRWARKSLADTRHGLLHRSQSEEVIKKAKGGARKGTPLERRSGRDGRTLGRDRSECQQRAPVNKRGGQQSAMVFPISVCLLFYFLVSSTFLRSLSSRCPRSFLISTLHILVAVRCGEKLYWP